MNDIHVATVELTKLLIQKANGLIDSGQHQSWTESDRRLVSAFENLRANMLEAGALARDAGFRTDDPETFTDVAEFVREAFLNSPTREFLVTHGQVEIQAPGVPNYVTTLWGGTTNCVSRFLRALANSL